MYPDRQGTGHSGQSSTAVYGSVTGVGSSLKESGEVVIVFGV